MKTKRIIALALMLVMLFSFTACKKTVTGNVNDMPTSAGTLYASFDYVVEGNNNYLKRDAKKDVNVKATADTLNFTFGFNADQANDFIASYDSWKVYTLNIKINNNTSVSQTFSEFSSKNALPDGMWLGKDSLNGTMSIVANETDVDFPAVVMIDTRKVSVADMYTALGSIAIEIKYFATPANGDDEAPASDHKKLAVTNNLVVPDMNKAPEEEISAKRTTIEDGSAYLESAKLNSVAFKNEAKLFGIDEATAEKILAENSGWAWYTLNIEIENKTADELNVLQVVVDNNGKNGVWISSVSQYGEYGMPANAKDVLPVSVLVDTSALGGKTVDAAISELSIKLGYTVGELIYDGETEDGFAPENALYLKYITVK